MKQKPTLNQADIELLKEVFVTKEEFANEMKPLKKGIAKIQKTLDVTIRHFDSRLDDHEKRIETVESKLGIKTI